MRRHVGILPELLNRKHVLWDEVERQSPVIYRALQVAFAMVGNRVDKTLRKAILLLAHQGFILVVCMCV